MKIFKTKLKITKKRALITFLILAILISFFTIGNKKAQSPHLGSVSSNQQTKPGNEDKNKKTNNSKEQSTTQDIVSIKTQHSIDQPGSIWWIINKTRPLPSGYIPDSLVNPDVTLRLGTGAQEMYIRADVAPAVQQMFSDASNAGHALLFASGYRSETLQTQLYNNYVQADGQEAADRYSARPGTSEHQTGLTFDVCLQNSLCNLEESFGHTPAGIWIAQNAHNYGFIIRYPSGKETITGYMYEPWHLRYVGVDLATKLANSGLTMEEYFNL